MKLKCKIRAMGRIRIKDKSGSYVILATILFSSMMILTAAVLHTAGEDAVSSTVDSFGRLWGRSVLAEYDINLKERYGIFAFYGDKKTVEEKLDFYAEYSFGDKEYVDVRPSECTLSEYSLAETENFKGQLKEAVLADTKPRALYRESENDDDKTNGKRNDYHGIETNRYIKNRGLISSLPSEGKGGGVGLFSLVAKLKEKKDAVSIAEAAAENVYMFRFFKHCMDDRQLGDTYFQNETEYILTGELNDEKAKKKAGNDIIFIRNSLNLTYLYTCKEKRDAVALVCELLFPAAPLAAQALMMESWAYMEARNDLKLLYAGKEVPLLKKDENWAVSLDNMLAAEYGCDSSGAEIDTETTRASASETGTSYIAPAKIEGKDYEGYLRILAAALPQETALNRMMDLIQINMKYLYCDYFLMSDYYVGVKYSVTVNDKKHEFEEKY